MSNESKFTDVPVESDTRILWQSVVKTGDYDTLLQVWSWEGVTAMSAIFATEDIHSLSDDELLELVKNHRKDLQESSTIKRGSKFCFVNFNFTLDRDDD